MSQFGINNLIHHAQGGASAASGLSPREWMGVLLFFNVDPRTHHFVGNQRQDQLVVLQFPCPMRFRPTAAEESLLAVDFVLIFPLWQTLALPAVHRLLLKLLADGEGDLGGPHRSGRLDVEVVAVLAYLHQGFGRRGPGHLPQHGVDPQYFQEIVKIFAAPHLPSASEVGHFV